MSTDPLPYFITAPYVMKKNQSQYSIYYRVIHYFSPNCAIVWGSNGALKTLLNFFSFISDGNE